MKGSDTLLIKATLETLTDKDVLALLERHKKEIARYKRLAAYYDGQHDILQKKARSNGAPNNKIVANYCAYITDMCTGFFIGQPVSYTSSNKNALQELNNIFKYNDEAAHNMDLAEAASIKGRAYELLYLDEDANLRFAKLDPEEVILIADARIGEEIRYAIRHYDVYAIDGQSYTTYVDVYDSEYCTSYELKNGMMQQLERDLHKFCGVPIIEYRNNDQGKADFEGVITLVDAYNKAQSLTMDDMEDFTDAFLVLKNLRGTNEADVEKMRRDKVLCVSDDGGAEWLIKNVNDTYIENLKTRLQRDIHKFSNIPDMSDEKFTGNTSGVAIKYKLIGLEQMRGRKERYFKKGLQRRIELICGILRINHKDFDFRDIEMTFTANIPANVEELADLITKLTGVVSQEKLLSLLPFIPDPQAEVLAVRQEQEDELGGAEYAVTQKESVAQNGEDSDSSGGDKEKV